MFAIQVIYFILLFFYSLTQGLGKYYCRSLALSRIYDVYNNTKLSLHNFMHVFSLAKRMCINLENRVAFR